MRAWLLGISVLLALTTVPMRAHVDDNGMVTSVQDVTYDATTQSVTVDGFVIGCGFTPTALVNLDRQFLSTVVAEAMDIGVYLGPDCDVQMPIHVVHTFTLSGPLYAGTHRVSFLLLHDSDSEWSNEFTFDVN